MRSGVISNIVCAMIGRVVYRAFNSAAARIYRGVQQIRPIDAAAITTNIAGLLAIRISPYGFDKAAIGAIIAINVLARLYKWLFIENVYCVACGYECAGVNMDNAFNREDLDLIGRITLIYVSTYASYISFLTMGNSVLTLFLLVSAVSYLHVCHYSVSVIEFCSLFILAHVMAMSALCSFIETKNIDDRIEAMLVQNPGEFMM